MEGITVDGYLAKMGYSIPADQTRGHIQEWMEWYQNEVESFHKYKIYNGVNISKEERYRIGMAKTVCEDWANLILNEKVEIHTGNETEDGILQAAFERNNFRVRANQLVEIAFALGTGAFVVYKNVDGKAEIDYIRADMIRPLSWENGEIKECAFASERQYQGEECIYLQIHRKGKEEEGENPINYYIENRIITVEGGEVETPETMVDKVDTGRDRPFFFIITPNIYNNIEPESPFGISVFANALLPIKAVDLIFDSYVNEYILGRKRIMVGARAVKRKMMEDGNEVPVFDPNDKVFMMYSDDSQNDTPVKEIDMSIRAEEHEKGLQRMLDVISFKCGMGTGRYKFENNSVRTATEVISANSDLYRNLKKHELIMEAALRGLINAILFVETGEESDEIKVGFDDSVIEDKEKERQTDRADVSMGAMQLWEYRKKHYNETEEQAKEAVMNENAGEVIM